ncbi:hypothetical protein T08_7140 [Trichinella sp. T8]|nr:hypothetical protein T08_7140 [Trichinella sp. T8]
MQSIHLSCPFSFALTKRVTLEVVFVLEVVKSGKHPITGYCDSRIFYRSRYTILTDVRLGICSHLAGGVRSCVCRCSTFPFFLPLCFIAFSLKKRRNTQAERFSYR